LGEIGRRGCSDGTATGQHGNTATRQHENTMIGGAKSANFEQSIPNPRFIIIQM
jgi:hypothetical protein